MSLHRRYKVKIEVYIKHLFMIPYVLKTSCYNYIYYSENYVLFELSSLVFWCWQCEQYCLSKKLTCCNNWWICSSMSPKFERVICNLRESSSLKSYNLKTAIVGPMFATIVSLLWLFQRWSFIMLAFSANNWTNISSGILSSTFHNIMDVLFSRNCCIL